MLRVGICGVIGDSGVVGTESTGAVVWLSSRSSGRWRPSSPSSSSCAPSDQVATSVATRAASSSPSSIARSRSRRGSSRTTVSSAPSESVTSSSSLATKPSHPSMPSKFAPSASRPSADDVHGCAVARSRAARRISSVATSSRQPKSQASSTARLDRWSATSKVLRRSTSAPKRSMRTGCDEVDPQTSTMPPRTATSPRCSTCGSRRYPIATSEDTSSSMLMRSPARTTTGSVGSGVSRWSSDLTGATTTFGFGPLARRHRMLSR